MRWFTSDTHFGHQNIIKYCDRPFHNVEDMDWTMICKWNAIVHPDDMVFHLGDVALGAIAESLPKIAQLNGTKILVPGNHDRIFSKEKEARRARFLPEYEKVFTQILPEHVVITLADGTNVNLSHFPFQGDSHDEDRFEDVRPPDDGQWIIHGHVHEKWKVNGRQINVGVDVWNFYPVSEDDIINIIHGV